jgi:hypothetical protein
MTFNTRYIAYAKEQGLPVEEQFALDKENSMVDFILWLQKKKDEFANLYPEEFIDRWTIADTSQDSKWEKFLSGELR